MDSSITITGNGSVSQAGNQQNLQSSSTTTLFPATGNLQPSGSTGSSSNLNTTSTLQGIPLSSLSSGAAMPVDTAPKKSHTPYLVSAGLIVIALAIVSLIVSSIISNRRLNID